MRINEKTIYELNGELISKKYVPASSEKSINWSSSNNNPIVISKNKSNAVYEVEIVIKDLTEELVKKSMSNLLNELIECVINFIGENIYYKCLYDKSISDEIFYNELEDNYCLKIKVFLNISEFYESIKTEVMNRVSTKTINVLGNINTPTIVEIIPSIDIIDLTIEGLADDPITIKNLKANKKVILDGELQKVTVDGVNKYGDTDMWDFPRLTPGANTIKVSRINCDITVKYKPRWI